MCRCDSPRRPHCCGGHEPGHDECPDQPDGDHLHQEEGGDDGGDLQHGELKTRHMRQKCLEINEFVIVDSPSIMH